MSNSSFNVNQKLGKIIKRKPNMPKGRLREVYDEILERVKRMKPSILTDKQKQIAYNRLYRSIKAGFPVSFCPDCPYNTHYYYDLRRHLKDKHGWRATELDIVRQGFHAAKDNKRLDYHP